VNLAVAVALAVALATFFQAVRLGYQVGGPETGSFRSTFSAEELLSASRDRETKWRGQAPVVPGLVSREEHYLSEALWAALAFGGRRPSVWTQRLDPAAIIRPMSATRSRTRSVHGQNLSSGRWFSL
jgi:hypothetical protein